MQFSSSLKLNHIFRRLYRKGQSAANGYLVLYCRKNGSRQNRIGLTVSAKLAHAVHRNRLRRQLREIYRLHEAQFARGYDIVVVARTRAIGADYAALERAEAVETAEQRSEAVEKMLAVVRFRLAHPDYLHCDAYGALLLDCFACCRTRLPQGYAAFHLPWVVEWYTAARQYKKVCELLTEFPDIRL